MLWEWPAYFTKEAIEEGIDVKISTWARNAPNTTPAMAKSVANYANAQLIKMEAVVDGYAEGIALDTDGNLSEGSGQNLFIVRDGVIYTPPIGNSVLSGITRDCVITIARDLGFEVREQTLPREMLYIGRRGVLRRHGRRGDADPVGGPHQGGPRPARARHRGHPAAVLPDRAGRRAGHARLAAVRADAGGHCIGSREKPINKPDMATLHVNDLLKIAVERGASDLHLKVGSYPMLRVRGGLDARHARTTASTTRT